jgi:plasmid stabilization system protein ParE
MDKIRKIEWTDDGYSSFEEVIQYIAKDSPYYAGIVAEKILLAIEKLMDFPEIGRVVPEYNNPRIREIIYKNYRIVYKLVEDVIFVVLVVHGSRDLEALLQFDIG